MILKESQLRNIIRRILFEDSNDDEEKKDVLGEPDQTMEPMRDDPDDEKKDEVNTVGALGAGGTGPESSGKISGWVGPVGSGDDQWNTVGVPGTKKKKKKKKWKVKK